MNNICDISLIVPMYNEHEVIDIFFDKIKQVLAKIQNYSYEIICINDGSKDNTLDILKTYAEKDKRIKIISFSRNFYKEQALFAGLEHSTGKAVIPMDVDLQDPPELILEFVKKWEEGYDVVYGMRADRRDDGFLKKISALAFYKLYNLIAERPVPYNTGDYRLMSRRVVEAVKQIKEKKLFMKGVFNWVGFKSCGIPYKRPERAAGTTKWNYWKLWNFALDGITSSTTLPLRVWTYVGGLIAIFSFIAASYVIIKTLMFGDPVRGFPTLAVMILFFGGIQLIALGIIGEYIGRIMAEVKNRPLYIIEEKVNFDE